MRYAAHGWLHTVVVGLRCKSTWCIELTGQINQTIWTYFVCYLCTKSCWFHLHCFCSIIQSSNPSESILHSALGSRPLLVVIYLDNIAMYGDTKEQVLEETL